MNDLVTRAISGHSTEQMQQHYSTVAQTEMREGIGDKDNNGQEGLGSQLADSA